MAEIFILGILSILLFIGFLITLILGLVMKNRNLVIAGVFCLVIFFITGGLAFYKTAIKVRAKVTETFKPRSGDEIYAALFGKPDTACVQILHSQDQKIPRIDYAIWLHFKTCPNELHRILSLQQFEKEKISTEDLYVDQPSENNQWFKPELMGDSIYIYKSNDEYSNGQTIYSNLNETEAYCKDVLD